MKQEIIKKNALLISAAITVITALLLLFTIIFFSTIYIEKIGLDMVIYLTIPTLLSLYIFPKILYEKYFKQHIHIYGTDKKKKDYLIAFILHLVFFTWYTLTFHHIFDSLFVLIATIVHFSIISLGEEFLCRNLLMNILRLKFTVWISILISSILFAFLLHGNEYFLINLFVRFPLGLIFGFIATKDDSIKYPKLLHTIYNLMVITFI